MNFKQIFKKLLPRKIWNLQHLFWAWFGVVKYRRPSEELLVIGVTGTSGKSSVIYFLRQVLESAGFKVGALSTIEFCIAGKCELNDRKMTMLGKMEIQQKLREMVEKGCDIVIIETTSEGALQHRHRFINYDMIALINLYQEHIEAHGSFSAYKQAKLYIFEYVSTSRRKRNFRFQISDFRDFIPKICVVNEISEYKKEFLRFNFDKKLIFKAEEVSADKEGLHFKVEDEDFDASLFGRYNAENLALVIIIAKSLGVELDKIKKAIKNLKPAPGRIEFIPEAEKHGFQVIVDFAFEPKQLQGLYEVVDLLKPIKIINVCGSTGGGRDKARRPKIGKLAGEKADIVIVTNEDPYDEDPMEIIKQVSAGAQEAGKKLNEDLFEILDRKEAVKKAVELAGKGDLVLVTGKGSEQKMCLAEGRMIDWDDRDAVKKTIQSVKDEG